MKVYTRYDALKFAIIGTVIGTLGGYCSGFKSGKKFVQQQYEKKEIKMTEMPSSFQNNDTLRVIIQNYNKREK